MTIPARQPHNQSYESAHAALQHLEKVAGKQAQAAIAGEPVVLVPFENPRKNGDKYAVPQLYFDFHGIGFSEFYCDARDRHSSFWKDMRLKAVAVSQELTNPRDERPSVPHTFRPLDDRGAEVVMPVSVAEHLDKLAGGRPSDPDPDAVIDHTTDWGWRPGMDDDDDA